MRWELLFMSLEKEMGEGSAEESTIYAIETRRRWGVDVDAGRAEEFDCIYSRKICAAARQESRSVAIDTSTMTKVSVLVLLDLYFT